MKTSIDGRVSSIDKEREVIPAVPSHISEICRFVYESVCKGRMMRTPANSGRDTDIAYAEPGVYPGLYPLQGGRGDFLESIAPGVAVIPGEGQMGGRDFGGNAAIQYTFLMALYHPGDGSGEDGVFHNASWAGLWEIENWMEDLVTALYQAGSVADMPIAQKDGNPVIKWEIYLEDRTTIDLRPIWACRVEAVFLLPSLCIGKSSEVTRLLL